jgi:hypothetical protein
MLFPAMVMDFVLLVWIKISSIAGIIHYVAVLIKQVAMGSVWGVLKSSKFY